MARALRVEKTVTIRCSAEELFEAITRASELAKWFADRASTDAREGGIVEFTWGSGPTARVSRARVLRVEPGGSVMMRWEDGISHSRDDYFSLTIDEQPDGTCAVTAVDFASKDALEELNEIWDESLLRLKQAYDRPNARRRTAKKVAKPTAKKAAASAPARKPAKPAAKKPAAKKPPARKKKKR